jgi:D-alanyl-D-alanine dipeptidase
MRKIQAILSGLLLSGMFFSNAQKFPDKCIYEQNMAKQGLIDIKTIDPSILVELKYSSNDNFIGKDVYGCITNCYLQKDAAKKLANASGYLHLQNSGYNLLVYDGARPASIQKILWESLKQYSPAKRQIFVANPTKGSIHNYGCAVDLTIVDAKGNALDMGTKFDYFGELAYPSKEEEMLKIGKLSKIQVANRRLLRKVMLKAGFTSIKYEWWHFNAVSRTNAKIKYKIVL